MHRLEWALLISASAAVVAGLAILALDKLING